MESVGFPQPFRLRAKDPDQRLMIEFFRKHARWIAAFMAISFILSSFVFSLLASL